MDCLKSLLLKRVLWLLVVVSLSFPSLRARGAPPPNLRDSGDTRLSIPVTIIRDRMFLGELLEELSKQSGVSVSARDVDGAAADRIAVCLKNVPLRDVMQSLWSLVSYQRAEWQWETAGDDPNHYAYRLLRPRAARSLSVTFRQEVQEDFENHAATLIQGLHLSPDERKQLAKNDPVAGALLADDQVVAGLSIFDQALSSEDKAAVLKGTKQVSIPVASLSASAQELVRSSTQDKGIYDVSARGERTPVPPPTSVSLSIVRSSGKISPTLIVTMEGFGGQGYMGGTPLNKQWETKTKNLWMFPGDASNNPMESREIVPPAPALAGKEAQKQRVLFSYLVQTAKSAPLC